MPRADQMQPETPIQTRVLAFYTALMRKDFGTWADLFAPGARQENPYLPSIDGLDASFEGRERILLHYRTVLENRQNLVFDILAIHETPDGDCAIAEVAGRSDVPETGRIYDQRYIWLFRYRDGKIVLMREYFNPLAFEAAFDGFLLGENAVAH